MRIRIDSIRARFGGLRCRPGDVCWLVRDVKTNDGLQTVVLSGKQVHQTSDRCSVHVLKGVR